MGYSRLTLRYVFPALTAGAWIATRLFLRRH